MGRLTLFAGLVALLAATAATAATPTQYRVRVNGICRGNTPKFKRLETTMTKEEKANDLNAYGVTFGEFLVAGLRQDVQLESVAVPQGLLQQMSPIITRLVMIDGHIRMGILDASKRDTAGFSKEMKAVETVAKPLDKLFDSAGLAYCGSLQP